MNLSRDYVSFFMFNNDTSFFVTMTPMFMLLYLRYHKLFPDLIPFLVKIAYLLIILPYDKTLI